MNIHRMVTILRSAVPNTEHLDQWGMQAKQSRVFPEVEQNGTEIVKRSGAWVQLRMAVDW